MADSLDAALQRSLLLGLQVLERASRRRVDWAQIRAADRRLGPALSETPPPTPQSSAEELRAAFSSISGFMTQTCTHCQRYHGSLSALSDSERRHVWRFHCQRPAPKQQPEDDEDVQDVEDVQDAEDVCVDVCPGFYSVTASDPRSPRQQTQQVSLGDGESAVLTFDL